MKRKFICIAILFGFDTPAVERLRRVCSDLRFNPLLSVVCDIRCLGTPAAILVTWGLISYELSIPKHKYSERS